VHVALLGRGRPDLTRVAEEVAVAAGGAWTAPWSLAVDEQRPTGGALRGLFAGGTLCDEAMVIAAESLGPIRSNIPLEPDWGLGADLRDAGHLMVDFGDDALTRGRAHPMIDQRARLERVAAEADDPTCGVLLLDVVLGHAANDDPAAELAPALAAARRTASDAGRDLAVVVSLCAAADDPQDPRRQAQALHDAGAAVFASNAAAARHAVSLVDGGDRS
jgi:FdrA protein